MGKIRNAFIKLRNHYDCWQERRKIKYTDFTIISNNCWSGLIYQKFGIRYATPTIGLFFMDEDYIKFISNLDYYLSLPLNFIKPRETKYYNHLFAEKHQEITYPIARLGDIEIFFMHYHSEKEAVEKWTKRISRINRNRLLVEMSQRDTIGIDILQRFEALPYKNKICFTAEEYQSQSGCIVHCSELHTLNIQGGDEITATLKHINIYELINSLK
jgi:uncharacterized protein (DUF1919 family)